MPSNAVKLCPEVCRIFCATANPVQALVARTELGCGVAGVVDWLVRYGLTQVGVEVSFRFLMAAMVIVWLIINELISILENVQREDLNPIEEAAAYESLVKKLGYTQEKLAERVGKSREYCANMMRLLKLPSEVQQLVIEKKLTNGHVRPLLSLEDDGAIYDAAMKIVHDKMSVREVEKYVHELNGTEKKAVKPEKKKDPMIRDIENRMSSKLGTQVEINSKKITISFSDTDDLNRILEELGCLEEGY